MRSIAYLALLIGCEGSSSLPATPDAGAAPSPDAGITAESGTDGGLAPIAIGEGYKPGLALDPAGTAYIAWYGPETTTSSLQFCRLPRGARSCDVRKPIQVPGTSLTRPFVMVSGTTVQVVSYRYGMQGTPNEAVFAYRSTDGGATFDAGRIIGAIPYHDALPGPGNTLSLTTDAYTPGLAFEAAPLDGSDPAKAHAVLSADHVYSGSVGLVDATTPIVVFADASGNAQFRRFSGTGLTNDSGSWSAPVNIGHGEYMHLASGSKGLFLKARTADAKLEVRRFDGATFAAGVNVPEGTGELPQSHLSQDPGGRLHAVWPRIDADGIRLYYATSDDGAAWDSRIVLTSADAIASMRVVAGTDHVGLAVWEGPAKAIRAVAVAP
jgi:hypothetical protein